MVIAALVVPFVAACSSGSGVPTVKRAAFSTKEFGVAVSPRVTNAKNPPKGGGRLVVGKPYVVRGQTYTPLKEPQGYVGSGTASWYGDDFHGRRTANGEIFSANAISGAHPTLPLPSYVRVTNVDNGRSVMVRVNDRGPYLHGRVMDLSYRAAEILGYTRAGTGNVRVEYVGPAPLNGDDTRMLLASVDRTTPLEREATRLAMNAEPGQGAVNVEGGRIGFADITGLFGYAESPAASRDIDGAFAAAEAMATRSAALGDWIAAVDTDQRALKLELGIFTDAAETERVAMAFAVLGAVSEEPVRVAAGDATRLTLTRLKPGVARADVVGVAADLGLTGLVLY